MPAAAPADDEEAGDEAPAAEETDSSVEYPIPGDHSFTMTSVTRMNVAEALGENDYSVTPSYDALVENTGVSIDFEMLSETTYLETLNLRLASEDYPDLFSQTVGSYDSKLQSAVETDILVDLRDYLDYAPDWARLLDTDEDYHMVQKSNVGLTTAYISTACPEPEVAMQFLNYGFTEEGRALVAYGIEDLTYTVDGDGNISYTDLLLNNPDGYTYDQAIVCCLASNWMPYEAEERSLNVQYTQPAVDAINLWTDNGGDSSMTIPTAAAPTGDDMLKVFELASDVLTHLSTVAPSVIMGTATGDDYRAAIEQCQGMGLEEITEIYQNAYNEYIGA